MPVKPKLAATVILLRNRKTELEPNDDCKFEVFMAKRHDTNKFLGGHHVFPGGSVDDQDEIIESRQRIIGLDEKCVNNLKNICNDPSILWIIAIRELFEETGILLAVDDSKKLIALSEAQKKKNQSYQEALQKNREMMTNILIRENLFYDAGKLKYFGRLVTPAISPIRFDTQFFLCKAPQDQNITLFKDELTEGLWASPAYILKLYMKKKIKIIFPQYSTLRRLKKFKTIREVFDNSKMAFRTNQLFRLG
jgi:8-oxo-dGTP pyrophosphatase MutT (NUDIX family)